MKKYSVVLFAFLFVLSMGFSSCARKGCHGGGWYGKRNLGYVPTEKRPVDLTKPVISIDEDLESEVTHP